VNSVVAYCVEAGCVSIAVTIFVCVVEAYDSNGKQRFAINFRR
jgi:hypothetical protein